MTLQQASSLKETYPTTPLVILKKEGSPLASEGKQTFCLIHFITDALTSTRMLLRPVGSGKTALTLALCKKMRDEYNIGEFPVFFASMEKH